jgi:hypothetical protein
VPATMPAIAKPSAMQTGAMPGRAMPTTGAFELPTQIQLTPDSVQMLMARRVRQSAHVQQQHAREARQHAQHAPPRQENFLQHRGGEHSIRTVG